MESDDRERKFFLFIGASSLLLQTYSWSLCKEYGCSYVHVYVFLWVNVNVELLSELRSNWEFAAIAQFLVQFRITLQLPQDYDTDVM